MNEFLDTTWPLLAIEGFLLCVVLYTNSEDIVDWFKRQVLWLRKKLKLR
jgi:methylase of polypeptide subunit release factors